jgi:hypothetical protein
MGGSGENNGIWGSLKFLRFIAEKSKLGKI